MGEKAISVLKFIAWLNLILGCLGALIIYTEFGTVEVPSTSFYGTYQQTNPVGIAISLALLLEAIIGCAFLLVVCSMANNLISIRENTMAIMKNFTETNFNNTDIIRYSETSERAHVDKSDLSPSIHDESSETNDDKKALSPLDELRGLWLYGHISLTEFNKRKKLLE